MTIRPQPIGYSVKGLVEAVRDLQLRVPWKLYETTLAAAAANIDITSISQAYKHLELLLYARGDTAATTVVVNMTFNGDGGANYDDQYCNASAAAVTAAEAFGGTAGLLMSLPAASAGANLFGQHTVKIGHYTNTANNKMWTQLAARKIGTTSGDLLVQTRAGFWRSNAAITQITLTPAAGNFAAGTICTLIGIP